jgi:hypothetical protein
MENSGLALHDGLLDKAPPPEWMAAAGSGRIESRKRSEKIAGGSWE